MSGGGGVRVSIPNNLRKTIQNMKEITRNHTDDEIYAMLTECSMDPNEAIHRLLFQDSFHEVKRKRDRKKEVQNPNNKESASRWTPNIHGRGNKVGRTNNSLHVSHDTGVGRSAPVKEDTKSQVADNTKSSTHERKFKADDPIISDIFGIEVKPLVSHKTDKTWSSQQLSQSGTIDKNSAIGFGSSNVQSKAISLSCNDSASSAVCFSASDPVLVPSDDVWRHSAVGAIKRGVGSPLSVDTTETKTYNASEIAHSLIQETAKPQGIPKSLANESQSSSSVILSGYTGSRPSSNYSNSSQQAIGSQKAPNKEWKPKQMNINISSGTGTPSDVEIPAISSDINAQTQPSIGVVNHEEKVSTLLMKFEDLHIKERKNVIIPNHIHVPESERFGLSFGSIDADFGVSLRKPSGISCDRNCVSSPKTSHTGEELAGEQPLSDQNLAANVDENDSDNSPQSPIHVPQNITCGDSNVSSDASPELNDTPETTLRHGGEQYSVVRQPLNPSNYYTQFYRSGTDSDGRISPFVFQGVGAKYNGNPQTSQCQQEGGNPLILSSTTPASLVSQAGGVMQALPQHLLPIFRPPTGVHLSHYPPNYIPYGHYFSPYYLPGPSAIHQYLGNGVFPQQPPPTGSLYPTPTPPTTTSPATGIKYPFPQYKAGGNSTHIGLPSGYGPYSSSPAAGNPNNNNEDLPDSQFKEGNTYITGQQSEASAVWVAGPGPGPGPGPDMSNLPASSFYNIHPHPQGQHVSFTPAQTGHGAYTNLYHHPGQGVTGAAVHPYLQPSQTMAGAPDMVGPTGNIYQQSTHPQENWLNNY
uniref:GBF-interacting protein 1 N-terminal domain-containing protein n=1 Tax=Kalanchoe fedtschenkoi TaxID=63787 RepID=A0A7N0VDB3_KALFE